MSPPDEDNKIKCPFCARHPWLATWGLDEKREPFVHMMIYKQKRIFGNLVARGGPVDLQCRECLRWLRINFVKASRPKFQQVRPEEIPVRTDTDAAGMVDAPEHA